MDEINASMPPELCAPAAAFLAHESCSLNGEVLQIGMGGVARIAVVRSQGISMQSADCGGHRRKPRPDHGSQRCAGDRIDQECFVTDFESVDFFTDESLVPDPYPYFDHLRSKCPVTPASQFEVLAVTGHEEALAVYKDPAFSSCRLGRGTVLRTALRPGRRRRHRVDRAAPRAGPDERTHHYPGSTASHPHPRPAEQAHHSQAPQGKRRLHVALGRQAARQVHRAAASASFWRTTRNRSPSSSLPICWACRPRTTTSSALSSRVNRSAPWARSRPPRTIRCNG